MVLFNKSRLEHTWKIRLFFFLSYVTIKKGKMVPQRNLIKQSNLYSKIQPKGPVKLSNFKETSLNGMTKNNKGEMNSLSVYK